MSPPAEPPERSPTRVPMVVFAGAIVVAAALSIGGTAAYFEFHPPAPAVGPTHTEVVDDLGRSVTVPTNPTRVVVLAPSIMDLVYRIGVRSTVVAVGCTADLPGGIYNEYSPAQLTLWDLSNASCVPDYPELNTGDVALLGPQVVLASTITSDLAVQTLTTTYGIPVVVLAPSTLDGIVGDVRVLAQIFPSASTQATALEGTLEGVLANASAEDAGFANANVSFPTVLLSYYFDNGGYYTYGPGSFGDSLISLAGGDNIAASVPLLYAELNASVALVDQPAVILYGTSTDSYLVAGETASVWAGAPDWSQLDGTKIAVDITLLTEPDAAMILALPTLLADLHPSA